MRAVGPPPPPGGTTIGPVATGVTGAYTLSGPFPPNTYSVVAEELGRGRDVEGVTIDDDTSASPAGVDLTLAPANVNVSYSSTPTGATILIGGTAVGTAGGAAVPRFENAFPYTFVRPPRRVPRQRGDDREPGAQRSSSRPTGGTWAR